MTSREEAVAVARRLMPKGGGGGGAGANVPGDRRGWLSAAGAYCPIGTPELDLCETPRGRRGRGTGGKMPPGKQASPTGEGSQWLPLIHDPSDRVVDYNAAAFSHLRREIRRSSRAIPACKAGQDLQEVMENPLLHTQQLASATAQATSHGDARYAHGHAHDDTKKARRKGRHGKKHAAEQAAAAGYMPLPAVEVVKSKGPAVPSTFESDAKERRAKIAARQPNSFAAMSPRHADEDESEVGENEDEYADDRFEADDPEDGDEELPEEGHEDSMLNEMLDELHSRKNRDVQKRMNEHGRNWRLVNSKANNELSEKLDDQKEQREQRAHSKLRVAKTVSGVGSGSAAAKARRHQMAFMAAKRRAKAQARFLRKHKVYAGIMQMIVERCNSAQQEAQRQEEEAAAAPTGGQAHAPPPSRPRPTPLEQMYARQTLAAKCPERCPLDSLTRVYVCCSVLGKLKVALLERAGLLPRTGPPSEWEAEEEAVVPGPHGVVDPKKVVLHKMIARGKLKMLCMGVNPAGVHVSPVGEWLAWSVWCACRYLLLVTGERFHPPAGGVL
jgi:hypothetical protein